MEFLVHLQVTWPPDNEPEQLARLVKVEHERAVELAAAGVIKRIWRIPGRTANWGLWEAPDATALHAALTSLPFFPWIDAEVHPLGAHPNDPPSWGPADAETDH